MIDEKALKVALSKHKGIAANVVMIEFLKSYLQALSPGSTGETDGWVLVPKEPTKAMIDAAALHARYPAEAYRAMLAAAGERDE